MLYLFCIKDKEMRDKVREMNDTFDSFVTYAGTILGVQLAISRIFSILISSNIALILDES